MWFCLNNAFLSVVENKDNPEELMVRARKQRHLENVFPDKKDQIYSVPHSDYAVRIKISREEFANLIKEKILNINYTNFKDSVVDDGLHDFYLDVWQSGLWNFFKNLENS